MNFSAIKARMANLQNRLTTGLRDGLGQSCGEDVWDYEHGRGGGVTRVYRGGVLQKGGVNFSGVEGRLRDSLAVGMGLEGGAPFSATGVSVVLHAENPFVPTVHLNVRYFECKGKWWFGGGIDLSPVYPFEEDARFFHRTLKDVCDRFEPDAYAKFKRWCDEYFHIKHRGEMRGVGGVFFDYLQSDRLKLERFVFEVGESLLTAYLPLALKRKDTPYEEKHLEFQRIRRGRYVEFNLVYDRGTRFGLETGGRTESILMSLPALASWEYDRPLSEEERQLSRYFQPMEWV